MHIDTISMELSILYFKGLLVIFFIKLCISVTEFFFILANRADPDEMPPCAAFHLGLHCLPNYGTYLPVSRMKRVKSFSLFSYFQK